MATTKVDLKGFNKYVRQISTYDYSMNQTSFLPLRKYLKKKYV